MKKIGVLLLMLLLFSLFLTILIKAQDTYLPPEVKGVEKLQNVTEQLTDEETRMQYLKQEWAKILEKSSAGRVILEIGKVFQVLSPVFKIFIGIEYSLSWLFFLSLGVWIAIIIMIYKPVKGFLQLHGWLPFAIAVIVTTLGSHFRVIQMIISFFLPLLKNDWIIVLSLVIGAVIVYFYSSVIDTFAKSIKEQTKKEAEQRREQKAETVEKLHDVEIKATGVK